MAKANEKELYTEDGEAAVGRFHGYYSLIGFGPGCHSGL